MVILRKVGMAHILYPYPATWFEVKDEDHSDHRGEPGSAIIHQPPGVHQLIRSVAFADPGLWVRREGDVQICRDTGRLVAQSVFQMGF